MPYQDSVEKIKKSASDYRRLICVIICLVVAIILIPIGAVLLTPTTTIQLKNKEIDYTECIYFKSVISGNEPIRCLDHLKTSKSCVCQHPFSVTEPLIGDEIILYYELESYDQTADSYKNSRDDRQLSGDLSGQLAIQCGSYSYDDTGKPIAPCGEIADKMFSDMFSIRKTTMEKPLNVTYYGMIDDKTGYRNPKRNESDTLENAFKGYAKPKSWTKNIWELDTENESNNGFENEQFIGWMTTSMKRKPYFRLQQNELEEGDYVLRVDYNYAPNIYNGTRKAILVAKKIIIDYSSYGKGVAWVVIGSLALVFAALVAVISVREEGMKFFMICRKKSNTNT